MALLIKNKPARKPHRFRFQPTKERPLTVFPEKRGDLEAVFLRRNRCLPAMRIKLSLRPFRRPRRPGNPCAACLYRASGRRVVARRIARFVLSSLLLLAQIYAHIGGQALEQGPGIPGLRIMPICPVE